MTLEQKQKIAEDLAQSYGYDYVKFITDIEDVSVFRGMTNEEKMIGLPLFVEVSDSGEVVESQDLKYMDLITDEDEKE